MKESKQAPTKKKRFPPEILTEMVSSRSYWLNETSPHHHNQSEWGRPTGKKQFGEGSLLYGARSDDNINLYVVSVGICYKRSGRPLTIIFVLVKSVIEKVIRLQLIQFTFILLTCNILYGHWASVGQQFNYIKLNIW